MSILRKNNKNIRLGEEKLNNQGCLMKIIEYIDKNNVIIQCAKIQYIIKEDMLVLI